MFGSTCAKCGNHSFSLVETEPAGSRVKWHFVQCSSCGVPVGVVDFFPNSAITRRMEKLDKNVGALSDQLTQLQAELHRLAQKTR